MSNKTRQRARARAQATGETYQTTLTKHRKPGGPPGTFDLICDACAQSLIDQISTARLLCLNDVQARPETTRRFYVCHGPSCEHDILARKESGGLDDESLDLADFVDEDRKNHRDALRPPGSERDAHGHRGGGGGGGSGTGWQQRGHRR